MHHSVVKAARLSGFSRESVVAIPTDDEYRLRGADLEGRIEADRRAGRRPFLVIASAGTTNTGAVDDLNGVADVAEREGLWFHVDAAYGGFFALTSRGRAAMRGIERADSVTLDPHKGLFLPYGTGALVVRDGDALHGAHSMFADYMPPMQDGRERIDFCEHGPELSRDFRGLRIWLPFKMHGAGAFREALDEKLDLARLAAEELKKIPGIEIVAPPVLSVTAFRLVEDGDDDDLANRRNEELLRRINRRGRVWLTATTLGGRFVIRICVLSFRTHEDRLREAIEIIREEVERPT